MRAVCFDLDDTLCKEIDYLKSAYKEIASYAAQKCLETNVNIQAEKAYEVMFRAFENGNNAFEVLNAYLGIDLAITDMLRIYREHVPQITLATDVRYTLEKLKSQGVLMGIVSDGRELTQWNKIRALGLTEWMDESCIIVNSSPDCFKPHSYGYDRFEAAARILSDNHKLSFTYVGDNLKKDFIYPKRRGWQTICLKDDGNNIHLQDFENTPTDALPDRVLESIKDIIDII